MIKKSILILAEGFEEKPYIEKIINFPSISKNYVFSPVINLKGNGKISSRYQYEFQTGRNDLVLIFADADRGSSQFIKIIEDVGEKIFGDKNKGKLVFIFSNPVTMQIVLSHFEKIDLKSRAKKINAAYIKELTGIDNYDAKEEQIKELMSKINYTNYKSMKENIKDLSDDYHIVPSSNILKFLLNFENDDTSWIDDINEQLNILEENENV